jgi:hypothetical protein
VSSTPTATKVLDGFLAARVAAASDERIARCREVTGALRTYVEARGAAAVDDLTAYRLTHDDRGREPTEHELAAVLAVIEHVTGFFKSLTEDESGAPTTTPVAAADVIRELAGWLVQRRLVDDDVAEHLDRYTHLYDGDQRTGT